MTELDTLIANYKDAKDDFVNEHGRPRHIIPRYDTAAHALADYVMVHLGTADTEARLNEIVGDFGNWINTPREPDGQTQHMLMAIDFLLKLKDPFFPERYDDEESK